LQRLERSTKLVCGDILQHQATLGGFNMRKVILSSACLPCGPSLLLLLLLLLLDNQVSLVAHLGFLNFHMTLFGQAK
jgi:hypothetical protein